MKGMRLYIPPLWSCGCGLQLWTWQAAARAERNGCPICMRYNVKYHLSFMREKKARCKPEEAIA